MKTLIAFALLVFGTIGMTDVVHRSMVPRPPMTFDGAMPPVGPNDTIPAFPGAAGYGAIALSKASPNDCRNKPLRIVRVTNTNDSGDGSLRVALSDSLSSSYYVIIIFLTGGTTRTQGTSYANMGSEANCTYIAGQTAPGDGFFVTNQTYGNPDEIFQFSGGSGRTQVSDVVLRYMTLRPNSNDSNNSFQWINVEFDNAIRFHIDHMTLGFSDDKEVSAWSNLGISNFDTVGEATISWLQVEPDANGYTGTGYIIGHNQTDLTYTKYIRPVTIMDNFCMARRRCPWMRDVEQGQVINNVNYGAYIEWQMVIASTRTRQQRYDVIRNYWKFGRYWNGIRFIGVDSIRTSPEWRTGPWPKFYLDRNIQTKYFPDTTAGLDTSVFHQFAAYTRSMPDSVYHSSSQITNPPYFYPDTARWSAAQAYDSVLYSSGNSARLNCSGILYRHRHWTDSLMVQHAQDSTGLATWSSASSWFGGGWSDTYAAGSACADADGDFLPDSFEMRCTGSTADATSLAPDSSMDDGYLMMEHYINGENGEGITVTWRDESINETGFELERKAAWAFTGWTVVDTIDPHIGQGDTVSYYDPAGIPADSYRVNAFNVSGKANAVPIRARCR